MIPNPSIYPDWKKWGQQLQQILTPLLESLEVSFFRQGNVLRVARHDVAALPSATVPGEIIFVNDETGGAVLAFSDGTNWRRVTDRAIVS